MSHLITIACTIFVLSCKHGSYHRVFRWQYNFVVHITVSSVDNTTLWFISPCLPLTIQLCGSYHCVFRWQYNFVVRITVSSVDNTTLWFISPCLPLTIQLCGSYHCVFRWQYNFVVRITVSSVDNTTLWFISLCLPFKLMRTVKISCCNRIALKQVTNDFIFVFGFQSSRREFNRPTDNFSSYLL